MTIPGSDTSTWRSTALLRCVFSCVLQLKGDLADILVRREEWERVLDRRVP